jgi:hypothetical protein
MIKKKYKPKDKKDQIAWRGPKKCKHYPVAELEGYLFPGKIAFGFFQKWRCYLCGKSLIATWKEI